ncbi:MAG TPA: Calx-beta domain-containing protein, partial [Acidimicrobiales bacterium]|nr:Calx-beta domain-containing protein [Acidimicrobiales bacterium]
MRARIVIGATVVLTVVGVAAFPQLGQAASKTVTVSSNNVTEGHIGNSPVTVTFTLGDDNASAVTVTYTTVEGTATKDVDYVHQTGTVNFAAHETSKQVVFNAKGDSIDENNEVFTVRVESVNGDGFSGAGNSGTVTINDDDQPPSVTIADVAQDEGSADNTMNFVARLSSPAGSAKSYYAYTANPRDTDPIKPGVQAPLAATPGTDYTPLTGLEVKFAAGAQTANIPVTIKGDLRDEFDEHFEVQLRDGTGTNAAELAHALGQIKDDDPLARLDVSDPAPVDEPDTPCSNAPGSITPCTQKFTFTITLTPASNKRVVVDYATEDRSATDGEDYEGESGSGDPEADPPNDGNGLNFLPGETTKTVDVYVIGDTNAEPDERFAFNLSNPVNATLGDAQAFGLITNDDGGSFPTVSVSNAPDAAESSGGTPGTSTFTITVVRPTKVPVDTSSVTVFYATADGPETGTGAKAVAGSDYVAKTGSVTIDWPATTATVPVSLINDSKNEPDEFFQLQLTDASNASITDAVGQAKITDEDPAPTLSIGDKTVAEGTSATATAGTMTVTLSGPSGQPVTVQYSTPQPNSGTATAGDDYSPVSGTLTFAAGETSKTFDIPVIADSNDEGNETVIAALNNATGAGINDGTGTLTITDDDNPPTITIGNTTHTEGSVDNTTATLPVTLSNASGKTVTVVVTTANGTATAPGDYTSKTQTLTFAPGETTKDFQVTVVADTVDEANETFTATLSSPTEATLGTPSTGTATIQDDDDPPGNTTTTTTTTTTTVPGSTTAKITTGPGPGGGPHIKVFNANGTGPTVGFMDGAEASGKRVARGDLNGDGVDEIITGSGPNSAAVLSAYSASGQLLASSFAYGNNGNFFGGIFVAAGDTDGDGKDEIITAPGPGGGPHVRQWTLSGSNLTGNDGFMAYGTNFTGGVTLASADTNGDGKSDIITGPGAGGGPHVRAFSGATGAELFGFMAYTNPQAQPNWTGGVNVAAGDLDDDGKAEVAVGPWQGGGPHLRLFNHDGTLRNGG